MAHEKRLDDAAYQKLRSSVPKLAFIYQEINKKYHEGKKLPKGTGPAWSQLVMNQKPAGIDEKDWLALIGEFQNRELLPSKEKVPPKHDPISIFRETQKAFLGNGTSQLSFF